jgi:hypothetical protein
MTTQPSGASAAKFSPEMQITLIEARECGADQALLADWLGRYPEISDEIVEFFLALQVIDGPEPAPDVALDAAVARGMALGLARVRALAVAPAISLGDALATAHVAKAQLARQVGIGTEVITKFVQGRIILSSVPARFFARVAQALGASVEQVRQWAEASTQIAPAPAPALRRDHARTPDAAPPAPETFADAVQATSPKSMSAADRAAWLEANQE